MSFISGRGDDIQDLKVYYEKINSEDLDAILGSRFIKGSNIFDYPIDLLFKGFATMYATVISFTNVN